jgi:hypothetical protein
MTTAKKENIRSILMKILNFNEENFDLGDSSYGIIGTSIEIMLHYDDASYSYYDKDNDEDVDYDTIDLYIESYHPVEIDMNDRDGSVRELQSALWKGVSVAIKRTIHDNNKGDFDALSSWTKGLQITEDLCGQLFDELTN